MGKRLDYTRLEEEYPNRGKQTYRKLLTPYRALLQKNYGKTKDCTLTCLACIYGAGHYASIERIAEKYGYDGETHGTYPVTVKAITKAFLAEWNLPGKPKSAYGKGVGWRWSTLKTLIGDRSTPVILNLWRDGRDYYNNHSVTVIGLEEYENARFLLIYDNWYEAVSLIDYNKLSIASSINWVQK